MPANMEIRKAAVLGAGVMGAGIAAHLANAGIDVVLLDVAVAGRDLAADAVAKQVKAGGFMHPSFAGRVATGTIDEDLDLLADADWIIEAVVELPDVKRDLYLRLNKVAKPDAVISSNTSTIPLQRLTDQMPVSVTRRFMVTHFFNPPRHMRLLEVVRGRDTDPVLAARVEAFADRGLGKSVVGCKDTPGFLANRIGCFWMSVAMRYAVEFGLTVEEADAVLGKPFGIPATGIFGLTDLVGIDLMPKVWDSFKAVLPANDLFHANHVPPRIVDQLIEAGWTGRKAGAGFYRKAKTGMEAVDLASGQYRPLIKPSLDSLGGGVDMRSVLTHPDKGGICAWAVMSRSLAYAASLVPEISDHADAIDEAMRLGYNWRWGPFELIDRLGASWLAQRLAEDGQAVPPFLSQAGEAGFYADGPSGPTILSPQGDRIAVRRPAGTLFIADLRRKGAVVARNEAATLWDMGDHVACLEFHRKMNAMAPESLVAIENAIQVVGRDFAGLVIGTDAPVFSVGADLGRFAQALEQGDLGFIADFVAQGQRAYEGLLRAPFPVVGAVAGMALGGGCEILLHCDAIQAHSESAIGLVERNVGLIPAWGGCRRMLVRAAANPDLAKGPVPGPMAVFEVIVSARVSKSAADASDLGFLRRTDGITMNRDRLLADAKAKAVSLVLGYRPPERTELRLPGASGRHTMMNRAEGLVPLGLLQGHDMVVAGALADILSGGPADPGKPVNEAAISELEAQAFMELASHSAGRERIVHMLKTGKPLKN